MTRTERNEAPRALVKDRHSRDGLKKDKVAGKGGAGAHNWGSYKDEGLFETQADADAAAEEGDDDGMFEMDDGVGALPKKRHPNANDTMAEDEGLKIDPKEYISRVDDNVATSPSESMSSLDSALANGNGHKAGQRRLSNVSDAERDQARLYREGIRGEMKKGQVDLAHIAKTSYGIAQSPPGSFSTSPSKAK